MSLGFPVQTRLPLETMGLPAQESMDLIYDLFCSRKKRYYWTGDMKYDKISLSFYDRAHRRYFYAFTLGNSKKLY